MLRSRNGAPPAAFGRVWRTISVRPNSLRK